MAKLFEILEAIVALMIISVRASDLPEVFGNNTKIIFATPDQIKDILKDYPKAVQLERKIQIVEETENKQNVAPRITVNYYLGSHTPYDYRVAYEVDGFSWAKARDVQMTLRYPPQGFGKIVTFVDIYVTQSSNTGRAYAVDGGIGYRFIVLVIEAYQTYQFEYVASIYGQD